MYFYLLNKCSFQINVSNLIIVHVSNEKFNIHSLILSIIIIIYLCMYLFERKKEIKKERNNF